MVTEFGQTFVQKAWPTELALEILLPVSILLRNVGILCKKGGCLWRGEE